ncbi:MAG: cytochrome b/b6 domain-containing protein [Deltaproteobacteria bacterium]|nr:cytochrome b/b6 domain-containing protein [Deltaproteobacteria bacterium]
MRNQDNERVLVDVWDWQTRALHWINAILVITLVLLILGKEGMEMIGIEKALRAPVKRAHAYLGYVFVLTFLLRVFWAFAGNAYARWSDIFPFSREKRQGLVQDIKWYLSGFRNHPAKVSGHDPLASIFYIALFIVLASQAATGLVLAGTEFKMLPGAAFLAGMSAPDMEELSGTLEEVHEFGFYFILFFLGAHLFGMVVHEVKEKTGLLSSMVHGKKYFPKE